MKRKANPVPQPDPNEAAKKALSERVEKILEMSRDLEAIYWLCKSDNFYAYKLAALLARRISYNDVIFTIGTLERETPLIPALARVKGVEV